MKYNILTESIPQEHRTSVNTKILQAIQVGSDAISQEQIFNAYTGDGGLHGLKFNNFSSYHAFSEAKKELENGQFYTHPEVAKAIVQIVAPSPSETIIDPTSGAGVFCNFIPSEKNFTGYDICSKSITVAQHLYPNATFEVKDLQSETPDTKFDIVLGNPPFNLKLYDHNRKESVNSQQLFFRKCHDLLKTGGIVAAIVPSSYLSDEMYYKAAIEELEEMFSFVGQFNLEENSFAYLGVKHFATKVIFLQKRSKHIIHTPYVNKVTLRRNIQKRLATRHQLKSALQLEFNKSIENDDFGFKCKKYLYEIKTHATLRPRLDDAIRYITRYQTEEKPLMMDEKEWNQKRLTKPKVLAYLKRIVKSQNYQPKVRPAQVIKKGYTLKAVGKGVTKMIEHGRKSATLNELVLSGKKFGGLLDNPYQKVINRKKALYNTVTTPFSEMEQCPEIEKWLSEFTFLNEDKEVCYFNGIQKHDLNLFLQKPYGLCNWQQGGGKTGACYAFYKFRANNSKKTFIVAPSLAINTTWSGFLNTQGENFTKLQKISDLSNFLSSDESIMLITFSKLIEYKKQLMKAVKSLSHKVTLIMDESDEICSNTSKRSKAARDIFRRARFKFLATGTTTRNNITELYPQLELLYNNSVCMIDKCQFTYKQTKEGDIKETKNKNFSLPFKAYYGFGQFKACFNPSKATVFGIKKQNQDIYNTENMLQIVDQSIITRKFKEIAGDKYTVQTNYVNQTDDEASVYKTIIREFYRLKDYYFQDTGNNRKESALKIIRQIQLLIKACSCPNLFPVYEGEELPSKFFKIAGLCKKYQEKVAIGCTRKEVVNMYVNNLQKIFPNRKIFRIVGDMSFSNRKELLSQFEATEDGILVCTQQSLKSSVNVPSCNKVIVESLQWNIPKIEQWYFRFIRYNSKEHTTVHFVCYDGTIEKNIMALLMDKEQINEFIKTKTVDTQAEVFESFGVDMGLFDNLMERTKDEDGRASLSWGTQKFV